MYNDEHMTWRNAAANASFVFYGPADPTPRSIWAGGFGWSDQTTTHIGVEADIDGADVTVDTAVAERWTQRHRVADAIWQHVIADDEPVTLPFVVGVEAEDRRIDVNGSPIVFNGIRVSGSARWSGSAVMGNMQVTITTNEPAIVAAIEPCDDRALPDTRPPIFRRPHQLIPGVAGRSV